MFQVDQLFQTAVIIPKTYLLFKISYIKDTNDFLKKLRSLPNLLDIILCTVDVLGLYPNISHEQGLCALRKRLDLRQEKDPAMSTC